MKAPLIQNDNFVKIAAPLAVGVFFLLIFFRSYITLR